MRTLINALWCDLDGVAVASSPGSGSGMKMTISALILEEAVS
jgi:hypothetical protein